jgi:hypothetical protein
VGTFLVSIDFTFYIVYASFESYIVRLLTKSDITEHTRGVGIAHCDAQFAKPCGTRDQRAISLGLS